MKQTKIEQDKATIRLMVDIYARHHPGFDGAALADYACRRLDHCRFGDEKPACKDCPVHCYAPAQRALMRQVMRWTGPRMLLYSPRATFRHLWQLVKYRWKRRRGR